MPTPATRARSPWAKRGESEREDQFWGIASVPAENSSLVEDFTMHPRPTLAARFTNNARRLGSNTALSEEAMLSVAPSIFAEGRHASRSARYTYTCREHRPQREPQ
jgi:hypothetical protein